MKISNKRVFRTMVAFALMTFSLLGCADDSYLYDEDIEDYYSDYDSEGMDDFYDSMPSDEDYYEGGSYGYDGQYYPATQGCDPCPAEIAHEMLHAFGAPDLYCADVYGDNYGVSEDQAYRNLFQY